MCAIPASCLQLRLPSINVAQSSTVGSTDIESVLNECNNYNQYLLRLPAVLFSTAATCFCCMTKRKALGHICVCIQILLALMSKSMKLILLGFHISTAFFIMRCLNTRGKTSAGRDLLLVLPRKTSGTTLGIGHSRSCSMHHRTCPCNAHNTTGPLAS